MHKNPTKCPALESKCRKCKKNGHWERKCLSSSVRDVTQSNSIEDSFYLGAVSKANSVEVV